MTTDSSETCAILALISAVCILEACRKSGDVSDASPPLVATPKVVIGSACDTSAAASCAICLGPERGFPHGYCSLDCKESGCPAGSVCVPDQRSFHCLKTCATTSDCRFADGYVCRRAQGRDVVVCLPSDAPLGRRGDRPCFGDGSDTLVRKTFTSPNILASRGSALAAEGNVVVSPKTNTVVTTFIARESESRPSSIGVAIVDGTKTTTATAASLDGALVDPVLAYAADGTLFLVFLEQRFEGATRRAALYVTSSRNDGLIWTTPNQIDDAACAIFCDKPWLEVTGAGKAERIHMAYANQSTNETFSVVLQTSRDRGVTWDKPSTIATSESTGRKPNLVSIAAGEDGVLHAAWIESLGPAARFGDAANVISYRSTKDGASFTTPIALSRAIDSPVFNQPMIAVEREAIHVAYVGGTAGGAWDIVLASIGAGGIMHRRVNDDRERCATHAFPAIAADRRNRTLHLLWLENRFGPGVAAYASCPFDAKLSCTENESISDRPFDLTTSRTPTRWHGDYQGIAVDKSGNIWASWSDTRFGAPAMHLAQGVIPK